jgi:alpha-mannosidase
VDSLASKIIDSFAVTVFNGSSFERSDLAVIPVKAGWEEGAWNDGEGKTLTAQRSGEEWQVFVEKMPSLGSKTIHFEPASAVSDAKQTPFVLKDSALTTPHYVIAWNEAGQLTSILDTNAKREVLAKGERGNVLQVFEDKPKDFEAWDIDLYYQEKMREVTELTSVEMIQNGLLTAVIRFAWSYMDSVITQDMTVYKDSRRIDFVTKIDWHEHQQLLKVAFPVSVRSTEATYDIQFGNVKRPTHWNTSWDFARFETVGHQWADLSERSYGVSLLNDCKYGYDIKDNVMRLSLIKSATYPDPQADQGGHEFTYALLPHTGDWVEGGTVQAAWALNNPLLSASGAVRDSGKALFKLNASNVRIDAVKKAEDSDAIVVRLHEFTGATSDVQLTSDYRITSWQESDLMEHPISALQEEAAIKFSLKPYEIKTFILILG